MENQLGTIGVNKKSKKIKIIVAIVVIIIISIIILIVISNSVTSSMKLVAEKENYFLQKENYQNAYNLLSLNARKRTSFQDFQKGFQAIEKTSKINNYMWINSNIEYTENIFNPSGTITYKVTMDDGNTILYRYIITKEDGEYKIDKFSARGK